MYNLVSIDPAENNSTQIRVVEQFERLNDALVVLKALESVNIVFNCYGIIEDSDLSNYKQVSFYCYETEEEIIFINGIKQNKGE